MDQDKLKPCPFCGGVGVVRRHYRNAFGYCHAVRCKDCGATAPTRHKWENREYNFQKNGILETLDRIAVIEGCECSSYDGLLCALCKIRDEARDAIEKTA